MSELKIYWIRDLEGHDFGYSVAVSIKSAREEFYGSGPGRWKHPEITVTEVKVQGFRIKLSPLEK